MKSPGLALATEENVALLTDLYELSMMQCYFKEGKDNAASFEMFARALPENRGFLVAAGLESVLAFLEKARFTADSISHLDSLEMFSQEFLRFLEGFRFQGEAWAVPEGTPVFANEPLLRITAPGTQAQFVETFVLNALNFQTSIASKAARVVQAARGKPVAEFGLRRAHGIDAGIKGARACFIAGCASTSNVLAGKLYGIPVSGTMAHSLVQSFESEREAFEAFGKAFQNNAVLLIDTYDTLKGAENAVAAAHSLAEKGIRVKAVRLDSGDLALLSRKVRKILDAAGLKEVGIFASGDLNERKIQALLEKNAPIDAFGVGTEMSTSKDAPALNGIYKMCEQEEGGKARYIMKLSAGKATLPGKKQVWRVKKNGKAVFDVLGLDGERLAGRPLLGKVMSRGRVCADLPSAKQIQDYAKREMAALPEGCKRLEKPAAFAVKISPALQALSKRLSSQLKERMRP